MQWPSDPAAERRWYQYYEQNDHFVKMVVSCESLIDVEINCKDSGSGDAFARLEKKASLSVIATEICKEGMISGKAMPFIRLNCPRCLGSIRDPEVPQCEHCGADVTSVDLLNPDQIGEDAGGYSLLPNPELQYVVLRRRPVEVYERLAPVVKRLVMEGKPIPLDKHAVSSLIAPSLVRNLIEGCPNQVACEVSLMWRTKVSSWVKETLVDEICRMRHLKTPEIVVRMPEVKTLQKYSPLEGAPWSWQQIRHTLKDF
jgi:hypothetical protein